MNDKEFKWTDADMREWGAYYAVQSSSETDFNLFRHFEKFKELKSKELSHKDYEILSFRKYGDSYVNGYAETTLRSNGLYLNDPDPNKEGFYPLQSCINDDWKIHSVKRLSDNEVFTIGDKCKAIMWDFVISSFEVKGSYVTIYAQGGGYCYLDKNLIKATPVPLFTTEDGKDIFEGDRYWFLVLPNLDDILLQERANKYTDVESKIYKRFSTEDKAKEYVLMNKPCLSLQEVLFWVDKPGIKDTWAGALFNGIKEGLYKLAQRKINNQ